MIKKILILTASYGQGHNIAALTLKEYYKNKGYETKIVDLVNFIDNFTGKITQSFYQDFCNKFPKVWEKTFNILDNERIKKIIFSFNYPIYQKKFNNLILDYQPSIVLSVFPFWGSFIKHNIDKNGKKYTTGIMITDSIKIHSIWYLGGDYIDKYFLIDNFSKREFIKKFNHKKENIIVSFFPIEQKYFINKKYINNKEIYILLTGLESKYITSLISYFKNTEYNITIIKGRNKILYNKLKREFNYINFKYIDFINLIEHYKYIGIFIGKAGGATMSECIFSDTPMIVPYFTPGQEEGNVQLIKKAQLGMYENDSFKSIFLIKYLNWNLILSNFKSLKKYNSCDIIYEELK